MLGYGFVVFVFPALVYGFFVLPGGPRAALAAREPDPPRGEDR
jgi:hypothetical protein